MGYCFNLTRITLDDYKRLLKEQYLIPSMLILRQNIDEIFDIISNTGIHNIEELYIKIKTKKRAEIFAEQYNIDNNYMIILRRSLMGFKTPIRKLKDYIILEEHWEKFDVLGLKTSEDLYYYFSENLEQDILNELGITKEQLGNLSHLMDVSRLRYVTPTFAETIIKSGYCSVDKLSRAEAQCLYEIFQETNDQLKLYKGVLSKNDMQFLIEDAKLFINTSIE